MEQNATPHPIVDVLEEQGRRQEWLARRIGYTRFHLNRVLRGVHPASPAFRAACATALGVDESGLFHVPSSDSAPSEDVDHAGANRATATEVAPIGR